MIFLIILLLEFFNLDFNIALQEDLHARGSVPEDVDSTDGGVGHSAGSHYTTTGRLPTLLTSPMGLPLHHRPPPLHQTVRQLKNIIMYKLNNI